MRLIDADVLKEDLTRFYDGEVVARRLIDEQPTVDAVPVVRCKDCKHSQLKTWFDCPMAHLPFDGDRWCWKGEREDGEAHENH